MADQKRNEFVLIKKVMIGMILLDMMFIVFFVATGNILGISCASGSGTSTSATCQLNNTVTGIQQISNSMINSFVCVNDQNISQTQNCAIKTPVYNYGFFSAVQDVLTAFLNILTGIISFVGYMVALVGYAIYITLFVVVELIPSLFGSLTVGGGIIGTFGLIVYVFTIIMAVLYVLYLILNRTPMVH